MDRMSLVTWNVAGLDDRRLDERSEAQCLEILLRPEPPSVIALQELVLRSWQAHWKHHLHHAGYVVIPADPSATDSSYFSGLAVRRDLPLGRSGVERFPTTRMGRSLLWCDVGGWLVCTAHLESERESSVERVRQLAAVVARLEAWPGPAVFAGDTNLRAAEEPSVAGLDRVRDVWQALGRRLASATTWSGSKAKARYDRVVANARVRPVKLATIGNAPVPEIGVRPSDHLGLLATLERDGSAPSERA